MKHPHCHITKRRCARHFECTIAIIRNFRRFVKILESGSNVWPGSCIARNNSRSLGRCFAYPLNNLPFFAPSALPDAEAWHVASLGNRVRLHLLPPLLRRPIWKTLQGFDLVKYHTQYHARSYKTLQYLFSPAAKMSQKSEHAISLCLDYADLLTGYEFLEEVK